MNLEENGYDVEWTLFESVKVRGGHKINLIEELSHLVFDHELKGQVVQWSYDTLEEKALISNSSFGQSRFVDSEKTSYYKDGGQVRPPEELRENLAGGIDVGDTVYFLASEDMLDDKISSAFLLTSEQGKEGVDSLNIEPPRYYKG